MSVSQVLREFYHEYQIMYILHIYVMYYLPFIIQYKGQSVTDDPSYLDIQQE